ncbi:DUF4292 domain-containing protein [Mangrovimonas aestuarii]|uniref:DUF4292 domain-containing protein n=1 Tax=Mangrovimonas aestuarii TaxID=3018443 RepID=UPI0023787B18|nr:DUF4292 domain-containing protein [Mangrovimonas aestuarii]
MRNNRFLSILLGAMMVVLGVGCKSARIATSDTPDLTLTAKQVVKENNRRTAKFKTLTAKVKANYTTVDDSKGTTINLRMEKDKAIWMSAPFSMAKLMITPLEVRFYNKLDNTFFEGDFELLTNLLGTEVDFQKVQNLLMGEALFELKGNDCELSVHENEYLLQPKQQPLLYELFYILSPKNFKISSQQLAQNSQSKLLQIDYLKYQDIGDQILPERIKVIALNVTEETIIDLEFKTVSLNDEVRFPFKIPSGFNELVLK